MSQADEQTVAMIIQMKTLLQVKGKCSRVAKLCQASVSFFLGNMWQHVATCGDLAILPHALLLHNALHHRSPQHMLDKLLLAEVDMHLLTVNDVELKSIVRWFHLASPESIPD